MKKTKDKCSVCQGQDHNARTCPQGQTGYARALPLLATHTNAEIARILGVPCHSVMRWRTKTGVPLPSHSRCRPLEDKYPGLLARLGKEPDAILGQVYGVGVACIGKIRRRQGIPKAKITRSFVLPPEVTGLLGVISDAEIQRRYPGISGERLRSARQTLGILSVTAEQDQKIRERLEAAKARIGSVPDAQLARELAVNLSTLTHFRKKHGILKSVSRKAPLTLKEAT